MNHRTFQMFLVVLFILIFMSGCAPTESVRTDQDLSSRANEEAARVHFEKAKSALANMVDQTVPALEEISKESAMALNLDPGNGNIRTFHDSLKEKINTLLSTVKSLYNQADYDMQRQDWVAAILKLRQVNKMFPNYEETGVKLAKIEQEGARLFYQQGLNAAKQENWKMATRAFKTAIEINQKYYDVEKLYQDAKSKDNFLYYTSGAEKAVQAKNWERAILMLDRALEYQPENQELLKKSTELKSKIGKVFIEETDGLADQGKLYSAIKRFDLAKSYMSSVQSDDTVREMTNKLCAKIMEKADKYIEHEMWGNALIWYQKVESLNPNQPELFQKILEVKDNINKRIRKSIAVFDFGSPSNSKDAGKIAANKLIAYLHKNASSDLRIIERENLQSILREMQLGQTGIVDVKSAQSVGKMRGIDTFIMGDVLQYSTKMMDSSGTSQVKVLVDEQEEPNPAYEFWRMSHPKPTQEDMASMPPMTRTKKSYQFVSYKQGISKISALLEISYKLVDTSTGENVYTNTIPGKLIKEDKYQDAVPAANISSDPLELPSELEVLDELTNEKISEMGQSVLKQFQSLEVEYFNQAEQQRVKRRNIDLAIEKYTDAIFDEKLKGISTPISQKSLEMIDKLIQGR